MVHIRPKGPVPVLALEWQISNEVPNNLSALKKAAELVTPEYIEVSTEQRERRWSLAGPWLGVFGVFTDFLSLRFLWDRVVRGS